MTIRHSDDGGYSWSEGFLMWEGPSAYSQLVSLGAGGMLSSPASRTHDAASAYSQLVVSSGRMLMSAASPS